MSEKPEWYLDYQRKYEPRRKAMKKRNGIRWIIAFASLSLIFFTPFPIGLIIALAVDGIVFSLNYRDIQKVHNSIQTDIEKDSASLSDKETRSEKQ
jgi:ABC-type sulfate transport system permease component